MVQSTRWLAFLALLAMTGATVHGESVKKDVPFVPTPEAVVEKMLQMANVQSSDVVYDLGCGDGRIVITAAKKYGARGIGYDIDPQRIKESKHNAAESGVSDKISFTRDNLFDANLKDATVVTLYLLPSVNLRLRPKLLNELKPGTRIVSHAFDMRDWKPDATAVAGGQNIYLWIVPAAVAGTWRCTLNSPDGPKEATLQIDQKYQQVSGTATIAGRKHTLADPKLFGDQLTFTIPGQPAVTYTGRVNDTGIQGTAQAQNAGATAMQFTATRQ